MYKTAYKEVEIEIDLSDFDDDDLIEEIESRGIDLNSKYISGDEMRELLTNIWDSRRRGLDYQQELNDLIWYGLGRIV